ncbi:DNA polymerase III subunit epsilon [compost metagenome]
MQQPNPVQSQDTPPSEELEAIARQLEASGNYRILRRFDPASVMIAEQDLPPSARRFLVVDTETTGKDAARDHIVELGMVEVAYDPEIGACYGVTRVFDALEDPGVPIPPEASAVNGITDEMVAGKRIDDAAVQEMVAGADFVVPHNARYDRVLLERRLPVFEDVAFACSMTQVDWQKAGIGGTKLEYIASRLGFFYSAHRADTDCLALVKVLDTVLEGFGGGTPLQMLLAEYQREDRRIWATGAPYDAKDRLKERGYRWFDGTIEGTEKAWAKEVPLEEYAAELAWLRTEVFNNRSVALPIDRIDARNRFTSRRDKLGRDYI